MRIQHLATGRDAPPREWAAAAACAAGNPEDWFRASCQPLAVAVCRACPARVPCLREALDHGEQDGVWGGLTAAERETAARSYARGASIASIIAAADLLSAVRETAAQAEASALRAQQVRRVRAQAAQARGALLRRAGRPAQTASRRAVA
jgi:WhiB family transcriptional regulator, redox-sensing transcriptional regulator